MVIGGDGSYMGAKLLTEEFGYPCIGIPGTIDNDIVGTDYTIGYQTALETALDAIDRLRDTSSSHQRISIVEIMGRHCGDLTLSAALAGGCEYVIVPEKGLDKDALMRSIEEGFHKGKRHSIIAITELMTDVHALAKEIEARFGNETRATVLGHIQRGGSPCAFDRILPPVWASMRWNYYCKALAVTVSVFKTSSWFTTILLMRSIICVVRSKKNYLKPLENYSNFSYNLKAAV